MVKVEVSGLKTEEHIFRDSLIAEGVATGEKLEKTVKFSPEDQLHITVKSTVEGKKKRFLVTSRIAVQGKVYFAGEPDNDFHRNVWDLHLAVKESLEELKNVVEKNARHKHIKGLTEEEALEKRRGPND